MSGYPARQEAEELLRQGKARNPDGNWDGHSRIAAQCAEKIAAAVGMNSEKAYVLGLLHDIGRAWGHGGISHVYHGWQDMLAAGYPVAARICLTHSFSWQNLRGYIGPHDVTPEQEREMENALAEIVYDDYDRLIQLCDCLAGPGVIMDLEKRMLDVKQRYGEYPQIKWDNNLALKAYFEARAGKDLYEIVR